MNWLKNAMGQASWAGAAGGTSALAKWGRMGVGSRYGASAGAGAILGAGWGATGGRDMGQSRFSGAMGGALQGALTGAGLYAGARYGRAAYRGANRVGAGMSFGAHLKASAEGAGKTAYRMARIDAGRSGKFIGNTLSKASNAFSGLFK